MKNFYLIQVTNLGFLFDHISPKINQLFDDYKGEPHNIPRNATVFATFMKHRQLRMIPDGNKNTQKVYMH